MVVRTRDRIRLGLPPFLPDKPDAGPQSATQTERSALLSLGRLVLRFRMASCCLKARFCRASSRRDLRLDRAVASRAYKR